jgi:ABC-type Fe3+/spermidine/putrescine transport system ATPase subunit
VAAALPVLEVRDLAKAYGSTPAVDGISLELYAGETLTLLGPSGCGKSTTLRAIAGLERPDQGEILVNGVTVFSAAKRVFVPPEKRNMGLVFQSYAIWPHMTVAQNVGYPLKIRHMPDQELKERVNRALELVGLGTFAARPATQLSGGQQQRVALARSLVYEPDILLLDEPLSNLDAALRQEVRVQIKQLQAELGTTILFVTHDQVEAMSLSHRIAVMNRGKIEQVGDPRVIYEQPLTYFVHSFIGKCMSIPAELRRENGSAWVEAPGAGRVEVWDGQADGLSGEVWLSIRPQDVQVLGAGPSSTMNRLQATLEQVSYLGDLYECSLRVGGAAIVLSASQPPARVGEVVTLGIRPGMAKVWPRT